jgi:hypothetical protein
MENTAKDVASKAKRAIQNSIDTSTDNIREGEFTKTIESQTAKIPSVGYLGLAMGSMALSLGVASLSRRKELGNFVGLWVPTFLLFGIYNKLVKLEGSDRFNSFKH